MLHLLISCLSECLRSHSTTFFFSPPPFLDSNCKKRAEFVIRRCCEFSPERLDDIYLCYCDSLPLPYRQQKTLPREICDWEFHRSKRRVQEWVNRRESYSIPLLANTVFSTGKRCDIYCLSAEQHLPSAVVTFFSKTHEYKDQSQR